MSYRSIQRKLRAFRSLINLNQTKVILLQELNRLQAQSLDFIELNSPESIMQCLATMNKDALCGELGNDAYWQGLEQTPVDIIIKAMQNGILVGIVLLRNNYVCQSTGCTTDSRSNSFYIELICSKGDGVGGKMMDHVKKLARAHKKAFLYLSALFHVITYYAKRHKFQISTDCYPKLEMEIDQLFDLRIETEYIFARRQELRLQLSRKPNRKEKYAINAERSGLNSRMKVATCRKHELLNTFRAVSTYTLKHPGRNTTIDDVLEQGVFMSLCL
jgi:hypothetical protein